MSPSQFTSPSPVRPPGRRGRVVAGTLAGTAAALLMFALSPSAAPNGTALAPASGTTTSGLAAVVDDSSVSSARVPAAAYSSVTAPRSAVLPVSPVAPAMGGSQAQAQSSAAAAHEMTVMSDEMSGDMSADSCAGVQAAAETFLDHFYAAHLEESPGQQAADALDVDQYALTHTVMIANMIKPLVSGSDAALGAFLDHFYAAHLEESPGQQAADLTDVDQYVETHTVLIEHLIAPLAGSDTSSC